MKCNKWIAPLLVIFLLQFGMTVGKSKSKCKRCKEIIINAQTAESGSSDNFKNNDNN